MPLYTFEFNGQVKDIYFNMDDNKVYIDEDGNKWTRVFLSPNASVDSISDPFSSRDFVEKSRAKKGNLGNLFDQAKEMSLKRQDKLGADPIKEKFYENYSKTRKGQQHPDVKKAKARKELKKFGITVTD